MKTIITNSLVSFFLVSALSACNTVSGIKEDFKDITDSSADEPSTQSVVVPSDRQQLVREVQTMLADRGYNPGPADGQAGPSTNSALREFQTASGLTATNGVTEEAYIQLASDKASGTTTQSREEDQRICANSFSVTGSFFSGKQYKVYQDFNGLSESRAFRNIAQYLGTTGWTIVNTDADLGVISATQGVVGNDGTVPTNIVVKEQGSNSLRVQATFSLSPGLVTSAEGQKDELCKIVEAASI